MQVNCTFIHRRHRKPFLPPLLPPGVLYIYNIHLLFNFCNKKLVYNENPRFLKFVILSLAFSLPLSLCLILVWPSYGYIIRIITSTPPCRHWSIKLALSFLFFPILFFFFLRLNNSQLSFSNCISITELGFGVEVRVVFFRKS